MRFEVYCRAEDEEEANQLECKINAFLGMDYMRVREIKDRRGART